MTLSPTGLALLKEHEGLRLTVYGDVGGKPTIGYGHLLTGQEPIVFQKGITEEQADQLLAADVLVAERQVMSLLEVGVTQEQFDALVDFQYNTGALAGSQLLRAVNAMSGPDDIRACLLAWDHYHDETGGLHVSSALLARRQAEAKAWPTADPSFDDSTPQTSG